MAPMLSKEMAKIDWKNKTANDIKNLVRGLNPIMGAYTFLDGKKIKFWKVQTLTENELLEKFQELEEYKYHLNKMQAGTVLFSDDKLREEWKWTIIRLLKMLCWLSNMPILP